MQRAEALTLMETHLPSPHLRKHSLASEAVMKALALRLGRDAVEAETWGVLGLLHDLDYEETQNEPTRHGARSVELLAERGLTPDGLAAIERHNAEALGLTRETTLDKALTCAEVVTGLITAAAMVQPDKKLASVKAASVVKKMKDKGFARSVNREHIKICQQLGLETLEFVELAITAMLPLADELGL